MSIFGKSYEERRDIDREDRRRYEGDVTYEVWASGGDIDAIDFDRVDDCRHEGMEADDAAKAELNLQRRTRRSDLDDDVEL